MLACRLSVVRVGTGRTVLDNKGNPIKQYEPFFSGSYGYEDEAELVEWGVTPILHYDGLGRLIRTDLPNGTYSKVVFDPWEERRYDPNDTVEDSLWYAERSVLDTSDPERRAADKGICAPGYAFGGACRFAGQAVFDHRGQRGHGAV